MLTTEAIKVPPADIHCAERCTVDDLQTIAVFDCVDCSTTQCIHTERELHKLSEDISHNDRIKLANLFDFIGQRTPSDNKHELSDIVCSDLPVCGEDNFLNKYSKEKKVHNQSAQCEQGARIDLILRSSIDSAYNRHASVIETTADSQFDQPW